MDQFPIPPSLFETFHGAIVECFTFETQRSRLELTLWLEPSHGIYHTRRSLYFSGIRNGAEVARLEKLIKAVLAASGRTTLGYRVDECCVLPRSTEGIMTLCLAIDHLPELLIRCQKVTSRQSNLHEDEV